MPPKAKITKEMILKAVLEITREIGFDAVNARMIAGKLNCSTRPIFTCYSNMDEMKKEFLEYAYEFYESYVSQYHEKSEIPSFLILPVSYIEFARDETNLFKLLFMNDMELKMSETKDFYSEIGNVKKAKAFAELIGTEIEDAKDIYLDFFLYSHGIAVLTATGKILFTRKTIEEMMDNMLSALIGQKRGIV